MITLQEIQHIARLSKVYLSPEEEAEMAKDLETILSYFQKIKELPTENILPALSPIEICNVVREDIEKASLPLDAIAKNSPSFEEGFFIVPKVLGT
ncbi:MAG: Asp-tRNA(Asn)/Glu-tRNA(Gln) amidotransferase subunit GatC [Candidatus Brocadiae bacterium]|nr:Asp-tRNA(Asn)/Glu-tRNA(Gln) amidotransferase subunit GatC [Candidatus Brocadiia bacterium]